MSELIGHGFVTGGKEYFFIEYNNYMYTPENCMPLYDMYCENCTNNLLYDDWYLVIKCKEKDKWDVKCCLSKYFRLCKDCSLCGKYCFRLFDKGYLNISENHVFKKV